jgi:hypothetical protein
LPGWTDDKKRSSVLLVPIRGFHSQEVVDEEVFEFAMGIVAAGGVVAAGDYEEIEVLVGFDQGVDHLEGGGGVDVVVEFADDQQKFALEAAGVVHVG